MPQHLCLLIAASLLILIAEPARGQEQSAFIDWFSLRNPILSMPDRMIKDQAVVYADGWFYVFASQRFEPETEEAYREKWSIWRSRDLKSFEAFQEPALHPGAGSPDITRHGDVWHLTCQKALSESNRRQLHYATSADLVHWTPLQPLLPGVHPETSCIDAAVGWVNGYAYLGYKLGQEFHVTRSQNRGIDGKWLPPQPASAGGAWAENYQFIQIDGTWRMIATARDPGGDGSGGYTGSHAPFIYRMEGDGDSLDHWAKWADMTLIEIPGEDWNTVMHANSAYLCDWRAQDGYFYLFYAGSNDAVRFKERGHAKVGVARSKDLKSWALPGAK
jgi:hypothetical protein